MTSNLLISYPSIPFVSTVVAEPTAATGYSTKNVVTGGRNELFKASANVTSTTWSYDTLSAYQPDHLIIARADLLYKRDSAATTWAVTGSAASSFTSPETKTGTYTTSNLVGPRSQDFITSFTFSTTYRYYRIVMTTTASFPHVLSKLYLGSAFDMGHEPVRDTRIQRMAGDAREKEPAYQFSLTWYGITDSKRNSFITNILAYKDVSPVFLWDQNDYIFNHHRLLHCKILQAKFEPVTTDSNTITVDFEELI